MAISLRCTCGKLIRLPDSAAGKKARCVKCQKLFTVPTATATVSASPQPVPPPEPTAMPHPEPQAPSEPPAVDMLYGLKEAEPEPPPLWTVRTRAQAQPAAAGSPEVEVEIEPADRVAEGSFWKDLPGSFFFFIDAGNSVTWVVVTLLSLIPVGLSFGPMFLVSILALILVNGYLAAFYLSIIRDSAGGEDELPTLALMDRAESLSNIIQFYGSKLLVLLPWLVYDCYLNWRSWGSPPGSISSPPTPAEANLLVFLGACGEVFWPAVILMVAIGGGFIALWPPVRIIRTMAAAPLAYLAVCAAVVGSQSLLDFIETKIAIQLNSRLVPPPFSTRVLFGLVTTVAAVYANIVSMRIVGLYYRHYKHRFPWAAE